MQLELPAVLGRLGQQVALAADEAHERHHELLAQRVNRRVGHLGEELLEVREEQLRPAREHRERRVVAHRADGLLPARGHRRDDHLQVFFGVPEDALLAAEDLRLLRRHLRGRQQAAQLDALLLDPVPVRALPRDLRLDLVVRDDAMLRQVHEEHFARLKPPSAEDAVAGNVQHARLGGEDHQPVARDGVARRAQAVAVERGADVRPVREDQRRRPVPRLHDGGMIFVEGALVLAHQELGAPRLGHEHHHHVRQRPAAHEQQLRPRCRAPRSRCRLRG